MPPLPTSQTSPSTILTITFTEGDAGESSGTLLIQRGELGQVRQFTWESLNDLSAILKAAWLDLSRVEADPPVVPEVPTETAKPPCTRQAEPKKATSQPSDKQADSATDEAMLEIPLRKGKRTIPAGNLSITGDEIDEALQQQAVVIAGRLIDGKLWDGQSPIVIADVFTSWSRMQHLSDKEFSLFSLDDFVQVSTPEADLV